MGAKVLASQLLLLSLVFALTHCGRDRAPGATRDAAASRDAKAAAAAVDPASELADMKNAGVPGLSIGTVDGDHIACHAHGLADTTTGRAATAGTVFPAASLAKPIVAITVLRLVEQQKLRLDGDITNYVEFPVRHVAKSARPITLRMLLTHTSGLHDDFDTLMAGSTVGGPPPPLRDFLRGYVTLPSDGGLGPFQDLPGESYDYSNVGFALAALAVESVEREPFHRVADRMVFRPLKMNAGFHAPAFAPADVAEPHVRHASGRFERVPLRAHSVYPASDLRADACSMARLAAALMRGGELDGVRILDPKSVEELFQATPTRWGERTFGFQKFPILDPAPFGHEGEDQGVSVVMAMMRPTKRAAIVLANGDAFSSGDRARAQGVTRVMARYIR